MAAGNRGATHLIPRIEKLLADESARVRGSGVWALAQLRDENVFRTLKTRHFSGEKDQDVQAEWDQAATAA